MKGVGLAAVGAALLLSTSPATANSRVSISHYEPLQQLSIERPGTAQQQKVHGSAPIGVRFDAFGRNFDLRLEPNDRLVSATSQTTLSGDVSVYRGSVAGEKDSWARIVLAEGVPRGLVRLGDDFYALEAVGEKVAGASGPIIYRLADTYISPGAMRCGAETSGSAEQMLGNVVGELSKAMAVTPGATRQIDISVIGDYEFFSDQGGDSEAALLTRLNNVDGIFSEQLGVQIRVDKLEVFTGRWDPFSDATDPGALLDELASYRIRRPEHRQQGLTHLYTGRNLDSNTVGIAFTDTLCDARFGAGLSQAGNNALFDSLIAAHEIGHNFGAPHDGEGGSACAAETGRFIMSPNLNGSEEFSQCSVGQMQQRIAAASCLVALPTVDMTVDFAGSSQPILLGSTQTLQFTVRNTGSETATGAAVTLMLPATVSLNSATASQGDCTSGAGAVDCHLGTVAGGTDRTVSLSVTAVDSGEADFVATVSADKDDNPGNNQETAYLVVEPAVNLVVNTTAAVQAHIDQSTSVAVELENRSALNATAVELSVSLDSGLQAEGASWPLGACTVTAQQVTCKTDSFPAESGATLSLDLMATASGQSNYQVSLSSREADADPVDNSISGAVNASASVSAASTAGAAGGGGGAAGLLSLAVLGCAALRRSRTSACRPQPQPY